MSDTGASLPGSTTAGESDVVVSEHFDAQDNRVAACFSPRGPLGPMVAFDGGAFLDPGTLRAFIRDLSGFAYRLERDHAKTKPHCTCPCGRGTNPGCAVCP